MNILRNFKKSIEKMQIKVYNFLSEYYRNRRKPMKNNIKGNILLFVTAIVWGVSFVSQSVGVETLSPFAFNGIRMLLGSLSLVPVLIFLDGKSENRKKLYTGGLICGLALGTASAVQTYAMKYTTAGRCGFITALYILFVPVIGIFLGKRFRKRVAYGIALALAGMYFLCIYGDTASFNFGDALTLVCSVCFAVHILCVDYFSPDVNGVALSCIQFFTAGVLNCAAMLVTGGVPSISEVTYCMVPILYSGIMSCGLAYTLQIIGQKSTEPTVASILMSFESVFAAIAGWIILGNVMKPHEIIGCVLMFASIILAQLPEKNKKIQTNV